MIFKSTTNIDIPAVKGVYQALINEANENATFIDGITGEKLTLDKLSSDSKKLAAGLIDKAEFKRGDVLAIFSPNQVDYPTVLFGTIAAGGIVTFVDSKYTVNDVAYQLKDSGAKYIVVFPSLLSKAIEAADAVNIPKSNIFLFGNEEIDEIKPYLFLKSEREANPIEYSPEEAKSTTAYLSYSFGTTGMIKGAETTHSNIVTNLAQIGCSNDDINSNTTFIGVLPLHHVYSMITLIHLTLLKGASVVLIPNFEFDLPTFCKTIQDYEVDVIHIVPSIAMSLVKDPISRKYDLSSLRSCISSAAPLSKELADSFARKFVPIRQSYGATEYSFTHFVKYAENIPIESIGKPIPNVECKIISEKGKELGYNQEGELCVRGPNVMKGYLNNKEATDACIDNEGWFHTGDIAKVDEFGNFYIVDRSKELIKYQGHQVSPIELESILNSHQSIDDAAVIGVYAEQEATECPAAYISLKQNVLESDQLKQEIKRYVEKRVPPYKRLSGGILFIDKIPKSSSGKILKKVLRNRIKKEHPYYRKQF
ncbi:acetyl-CoA synthetase-like protein [Rhizophagus irregularis]|uniref:Acetyl-CoA synthetase-like protein n=1 Tax=Rhizophagus irregularis TaxID=588596 RepID=A0A2I1G5H5_9GLOM|nr:acetyl-CoA synthetase-like protein [Rhizophagus irregularis]